MDRAYKIVDVFSSRPLLGNPVGVVLDAVGLADDDMQRIAAWTNLSETTFLLPATVPGADYQLRIFTPRSELPFAGHPTLGSAHAALEANRITPCGNRIIQECGVGLVHISVVGSASERRLELRLPSPKVTPLTTSDIEEMEAILGTKVLRETPPAIINVGAIWAVAQLPSAERVIALEPDLRRSAAFEKRLSLTGITVFGRHPAGEAQFEVRSFAPSCGVDEDPCCGSGNGCVAVFQHLNGMIAESATYMAAQGRRVGRDGRIFVSVDQGGIIDLGGFCVTTVNGELRF